MHRAATLPTSQVSADEGRADKRLFLVIPQGPDILLLAMEYELMHTLRPGWLQILLPFSPTKQSTPMQGL